MDPIEFLVSLITGQADTFVNISFTAEQLRNLALAGVTAPRIIDILRVGTYNIVLRLNERFHNFPIKPNDLAGSMAGKIFTYIVVLAYALIFTISFGMLQKGDLGEVLITAYSFYLISQVIYNNLGYEKSEERKAITRTVDIIGPSSDQVDKDSPSLVG